ncbi:MAG: hypothetical protein IKD53_04905, partial [Clostridia bacterium]|nr:hypothetical protein [Clostridia bacterium]
ITTKKSEECSVVRAVERKACLPESDAPRCAQMKADSKQKDADLCAELGRQGPKNDHISGENARFAVDNGESCRYNSKRKCHNKGTL